MMRPLKHRTVRTTRGASGAVEIKSRLRPRLSSPVGKEIDDIYHQLDDLLTRMAEIQLQFDRLRSAIRQL